ncbi:hypothetical protein BD770DRAFT_382375 [Pilaira anomala]|nr:hypothetical protein BD770DRAFT_382375 [Pilaira anomala]
MQCRIHMRQSHRIYASTLYHSTNLSNRCLKYNITFGNKTLSSEHKKQFHSSNEAVINI